MNRLQGIQSQTHFFVQVARQGRQGPPEENSLHENITIEYYYYEEMKAEGSYEQASRNRSRK